jgi:DNA-binding NarL/FixJ family response regulator
VVLQENGVFLKSFTKDYQAQILSVIRGGGGDIFKNKIIDISRYDKFFALKIRPKTKFDNLTDRQKQVSKLLNNGMTYKEIAIVIGISRHTVVKHVNAIFDRLSIKKSAQLRNFIIK